MLKRLEDYGPFLLKIAIIFLSLPAIILFGFIGYSIILGFNDGFAPWFLYPVYLLMMTVSFVFCYVLIPSFRIVVLYEKNRFYSQETLKAMHQVINRLLLITTLLFVQLPFWYLIAQWDDAPGLIIIFLYVLGVSFTFSLLAILLKRIIGEKID